MRRCEHLSFDETYSFSILLVSLVTSTAHGCFWKHTRSNLKNDIGDHGIFFFFSKNKLNPNLLKIRHNSRVEV